jgi:hypothetical protein
MFFKSSAKTKTVESPSAMLKRVEAEIKASELRAEHAARMAEKNREITETRVESIKVEADTIKTIKRERFDTVVSRVINYAPLVIISGLAMTGQYGKFSGYMTAQFGSVVGTFVAALCALALELIALFLGLHGMKALRRKDSAALLLGGATAVAGLVAWMNFSYFGGIVGTTFALFSFVAPFMWRTKIRSDHRDELASNGEIEKRALKMERVRWMMHPLDSFRVYRHAAWTGQRDIELAVKEWEASKSERQPKISNKIDVTEIDMLHAMIEDIRQTMSDNGTELPEIPQRLNNRRAITNGQTVNGYRMDHPKWDEGVSIYEASIDAGQPLKQAELAGELGMSNRVLAGQIQKFVHERNERNSERHDGSDLSPETA